MIAALSAALLALAGASPMSTFSWFAGTWTCTSSYGTSSWHIHAPRSGGWSRLDYGVGGQVGGDAVVGHLPALKSWIYDDYHADGSYARNTAADPTGALWTWRGTYYPVHGGKPLTGKVEWRIKGAARFDMLFYPAASAKSDVPSGSQSCTRRP